MRPTIGVSLAFLGKYGGSIFKNLQVSHQRRMIMVSQLVRLGSDLLLSKMLVIKGNEQEKKNVIVMVIV